MKMSKDLQIKRGFQIAGNILMVLAIVFILMKGVQIWDELRTEISSVRLCYPLVAMLIYAGLVILLAVVYVRNLSLLSNKKNLRTSIYAYCKANLYKYIPGNIFHYVGRSQIAFDEELTQGKVISASVLEIAMLTLSGLLLSIIFAGQLTSTWIGDTGIPLWVGIIILALVILAAVALMNPSLRKYFSNAIKSVYGQVRQVGIVAIIISICIYVFYFIINGMLFILLLIGAGYEIQSADVLAIIGANTFAWLLGFLTPGAPAGLGIREVAMYALLGGAVGSQTIIVAVLLYRTVTILGDLLAYAASYFIRIGHAGKKNAQPGLES